MKSVRQNKIMDMLSIEHFLKTDDLAKKLDVSVETIRRDINVLQAKQMLRKVYGGIELLPASTIVTNEEAWDARLQQCHKEKLAIATKALELIPDNATLALDVGTTMYTFASLLSSKKELTVITNSLQIANDMAHNTDHTIYCIGGLMAKVENGVGGTVACDFLNNFAAIDYYMCSVDGLTIENSITEVDEVVVTVKRRLVEKADKVICLVDHSKFGKCALFTICDFKDIDVLITDSGTDEWYLKQLRAAGVRVITTD